MRKFIYTILIIAFVSSVNAQWVKKADGLDTTKAITGFVQLGTNIYTCYYGGVFLSTNNGDNWSSVSSGLTHTSVLSLAGSGTNLFAGTYGGGICRSTNSGINWIYSGLNGHRIWSLHIKGTVVFAGTEYSGLYRSLDSGVSWSYANLGTRFVFSIASYGDTIFAGTRYGLYRSTNNGINWSNIANFGVDIGALAINGQYIFAGTSGSSGIYVSTNNGTNWAASNSGLSHFMIHCFMISGNNIFAGSNGGGVYLSTNNGANWIQKMEGMPPGTSVGRLLANNNFIFAGTNAGGLLWRRPLTDLIIPASPSLISPANNSTEHPLSLNLVWNKTQHSTKFRLLLSTDSLFTNVILNDSLLTDSIKSLTNLTPLTNYYWKVSSGNTAGWSSYSSFYKFKTIGNPTQVVLNLPANNSVNQPVNITFKWYKAFDQTVKTKAISKYWLEYSTDSTFVNSVVKDSTLTDSLKSVSGLNTAAKYFWRVKAKNIAGWGNFSSVWNFTTVPPIPAIPSLVSPVNNSVDLILTPALDWNNVSYAASYRIQISTSSAFTTTVYDSAGLTISGITVPSGKLTTNTQYYWRVNASNVSGTGSYSTVWNFTTSPNLPNMPVLSLPANNSTGQPTSINFVWFKAVETKKGDAPLAISKYWFEYGIDSTFTTVTGRDTIITDTLKAVSGLSNNTKYFWRVKAKNQTGWGNFSSVWNFRTILPVPAAPLLVSPLNNATNLQPNLLLDWASVQYAVSYRIQIANDSLFAGIVYDTNSVVPDSLRVRSGLLLSNSKYYWRINATNVSGTGQWSTVWNFRINPTGINQIGSEIPTAFSLNQNYPNPFNPVTKIRFLIPAVDSRVHGNDRVLLKVYDIMGREVQTLVNESLQPGTYDVTFDGSNLNSGIYFYKIVAGDFVETRKMLMIK